LLIIILHGIVVSQKYWATSRLTNEIPIDTIKIIGGLIDCKRNNLLNEGLKSSLTDPVLTVIIQIMAKIEPVETRIRV